MCIDMGDPERALIPISKGQRTDPADRNKFRMAINPLWAVFCFCLSKNPLKQCFPASGSDEHGTDYRRAGGR